MDKFLIMLSTCILILLGGCKDQNDSPDELILYQTVWKGTLDNHDDGKKYGILVSFSSEEGGFYDATLMEEGSQLESLSFLYKHEGKNIHIYSLSTNTLIDGYWWMTEYSHNELKLMTFPGSSYSSFMILTKVI